MESNESAVAVGSAAQGRDLGVGDPWPLGSLVRPGWSNGLVVSNCDCVRADPGYMDVIGPPVWSLGPRGLKQDRILTGVHIIVREIEDRLAYVDAGLEFNPRRHHEPGFGPEK